MKYSRKIFIVACILLISFFNIAVLHLYLMDKSGTAEYGCITKATQNMDCALSGSGVAVFTSHLAALQSLLSGTAQSSKVFLTILIITLPFLLLLPFGLFRDRGKFIRLRSLIDKIRLIFDFIFGNQIGFWLKLLQRRAIGSAPKRMQQLLAA